MGPKNYIITITKGTETKVFEVPYGQRIMMGDRSFITAGVTPNEELPKNVKVELKTRDN